MGSKIIYLFGRLVGILMAVLSVIHLTGSTPAQLFSSPSWEHIIAPLGLLIATFSDQQTWAPKPPTENDIQLFKELSPAFEKAIYAAKWKEDNLESVFSRINMVTTIIEKLSSAERLFNDPKLEKKRAALAIEVENLSQTLSDYRNGQSPDTRADVFYGQANRDKFKDQLAQQLANIRTKIVDINKAANKMGLAPR